MWWLIPVIVVIKYLASGNTPSPTPNNPITTETIAKLDKYVWNPQYNPYNT